MNNEITTDEYIENRKLEYDYYNIKKRSEEGNINIYNNPEIIDRLKTMGIHDPKYSNDEYLRKISQINYVEFIYENFLKINPGYKKCVMLHLPIFNMNGSAELSPQDTPIIILDYFLLSSVRLICYSFVTFLFITGGSFQFYDGHESKEKIILNNVVPTWIGFVKFFKYKSQDDLKSGLKSIDLFNNENWRIINNSMLLSNAIILYLICHEQAHHQLGHVMNTNYALNTSSFKFSKQITEEKRNNEFEADKLALHMFMQCISPKSEFGLFKNLGSFYLAPFYFFEILHSTEWICSFEEDKSLHPRAKKRYMNILKEFKYEKYKRDVPIDEIETWDNYFQKLINIVQIK